MAELNVERKKHSAWPWIVGLLAVLLALWAFSQMNDGNDAAATAQASSETIGTAPATTDATDDSTATNSSATNSTATTGEAPRDDTATTGEAPADGYAP